MSVESDIRAAGTLARGFQKVALGWLLIAVLALITAWLVRIRPPEVATGRTADAVMDRDDPEPVDASAALAALRSRRRALIRPLQVRAAVKDTGAAAELAKRLHLQGIVRLRGQNVAYIEIKNQGVKAVRTGDTLLGFTVKDIDFGRVTLSLEGVEVVLGP